MIYYKSGYKYQLTREYGLQTSVFPFQFIDHPYVKLSTGGDMLISSGYAWDGATWAIDTKNFMRASLVHDAFYQLIREGLLPTVFRRAADEELFRICREDGMSQIRAWTVFRAVRFAALFYDQKAVAPKPELSAP